MSASLKHDLRSSFVWKHDIWAGAAASSGKAGAFPTMSFWAAPVPTTLLTRSICRPKPACGQLIRCLAQQKPQRRLQVDSRLNAWWYHVTSNTGKPRSLFPKPGKPHCLQDPELMQAGCRKIQDAQTGANSAPLPVRSRQASSTA